MPILTDGDLALLDALRRDLAVARYAARTIEQYASAARRFLRFLRERRVEVRDAEPAHVRLWIRACHKRFTRVHGRVPRPGWRQYQRGAARHVVRVAGHPWPPMRERRWPSEVARQIQDMGYAHWLRDVRGLAPWTIHARLYEAHRFLEWLLSGSGGLHLAALTPEQVDEYLQWRVAAVRRSTRKFIGLNVRSFLQHFHRSGLVHEDYSKRVLMPSLYQFELIPSCLSAEDIEAVIRVTSEDKSHRGLRDVAILQLLATYGLRAGEVTRLSLDGIDWRRDRLTIRHSKTFALSTLPLTGPVGTALLRYIQEGRPPTSAREVFVRSIAPYRPFPRGSALYQLVRRRLDAAGVSTPGKRGPHAFRHACAVGLLRARVPVNAIANVLGHSSVRSVSAYLRLHDEDLRDVALPVPDREVRP
jgi:integrase/recombinase XerD